MNKVLEYDYDELQVYFGEPYQITDKILITQPSIGQILEFGEKKFYSIVSTLCANTTSFRLQLWDAGIDWNKISDFELFSQLSKGFKKDDTYLLFGDIDFSWFEMYLDSSKCTEENTEPEPCMVYILRDKDGNKIDTDLNKTIIIDENVYLKIVNYLRFIFDIHPKNEFAKGKATKEAIIDEERMNFTIEQEKRKKNGDRNKSILYPLVSSMLNHPGFKYKKNELKEVGIFEFMDSVKRLQTYEGVKALMSGMYSGMVDCSKMDLNKELNWTKDLYEK